MRRTQTCEDTEERQLQVEEIASSNAWRWEQLWHIGGSEKPGKLHCGKQGGKYQGKSSEGWAGARSCRDFLVLQTKSI